MAEQEPKTRKVTLPPGYADEDEFLKEARERFQQALDFDRENRDAALEDLKFLSGEQWTVEDKAARAGLPCLVINRLPQFVAQVVGDIRINRPAIKVRPAEDADKDLADIREGLIRAIERDNDAPGVYASTGESQVACGIGNFRVGLKYASDDGFDSDIIIDAIPNPLAVVWDPLSTERTGRDAGYCFVVDKMDRKAFEKAYKDELPSDLEIPLNDTHGWYTTDTVRITEYWVMVERPVKLALLEGGLVVPLDQVPPGAKPLKTRTAPKRSACKYLITGKAVLSGPHELPIDRVPIIRARGWEINVGEKRVRFGLVRFAKDAQKLTNYWRSVMAQAIALAPKGKWLASVAAVPEDREDDFRTAAKSTDPLLLYEGPQAPTYVGPPPVPAALLQEAALNAQDMKDTTGLHDASLGATSNETSGRAIQARQKEGDVASYIYHDNLQASIREGGRVVNQLIPVAIDTPRTIRIVGEDESTSTQRVNDPSHPDSVDINQGKYDVVIEAGPSYSTRRAEAAESMTEFMRVFPQAAPFIGDLYVKAQDWPMSEDIGERLKKMLPPQLQTDDQGNPVQPPPPDPTQQQLAGFALKKAQSEAMLAEAQAISAQADAALKHLQADQAYSSVNMTADQGFEQALAQAGPSGQGMATPEQTAPPQAQPTPQFG